MVAGFGAYEPVQPCHTFPSSLFRTVAFCLSPFRSVSYRAFCIVDLGNYLGQNGTMAGTACNQINELEMAYRVHSLWGMEGGIMENEKEMAAAIQYLIKRFAGRMEYPQDVEAIKKAETALQHYWEKNQA